MPSYTIPPINNAPDYDAADIGPDADMSDAMDDSDDDGDDGDSD